MPWKEHGSGYTKKGAKPGKGGFIKDLGQYEKLKSTGMDKKKAAAIANSPHKIHRKSPLDKADHRILPEVAQRTKRMYLPKHAAAGLPKHIKRVKGVAVPLAMKHSKLMYDVSEGFTDLFKGAGGDIVRWTPEVGHGLGNGTRYAKQGRSGFKVTDAAKGPGHIHEATRGFKGGFQGGLRTQKTVLRQSMRMAGVRGPYADRMTNQARAGFKATKQRLGEQSPHPNTFRASAGAGTGAGRASGWAITHPNETIFGATAAAATANGYRAFHKQKELQRQRAQKAAATRRANQQKKQEGTTMAKSAFGIDHGEISKAARKTTTPPSTGRIVAAGLLAPFHGAVAGKKGYKLRSFGNELGGAAAGNVAGALAGAALKKPNVGRALGSAGSIGGAVGGMYRAQHRGYLKRER